jgi:hypothetical protein
MSWTEIAGFAAGAVSVWLYVWQNVWAALDRLLADRIGAR